MTHTEREFQLEEFKEVFSSRIGPDKMHQLQFRTYEVYGEMVLEIQKKFWGEKRQKEIYVKFQKPSSWWQHFKQECFPKFLLRRYPVKMQTITKEINIDRTYEFPDAYVEGNRNLGRFFVRDYYDVGLMDCGRPIDYL